MRLNEQLEALHKEYEDVKPGSVVLMEICGTHTMAIAKAGLRQLLPEGIRLISGPGCPVCVTPAAQIDRILALSDRPDVIITTYGDLLRVPGSRRGDTLARHKAGGSDVRIVYSPMDALELAQQNPDKNVVFAGVGFETSAPGTAASLLAAAEDGVHNFSVLSYLKTTEPAVRTLLKDTAHPIDGFLCPGHVASIIGAEAFRFLPEEYGVPAVVGGFEKESVAAAVIRLAHLVHHAQEEKNAGETTGTAGDTESTGTTETAGVTKAAALENLYTRAVTAEGNQAAKACMDIVFEPCDTEWRGLGRIPGSGLRIREAYKAHDAERRFFGTEGEHSEDQQTAEGNGYTGEPAGCRCGEILKGVLSPEDCPLFGRVCTPMDPVGPCMVSSEGACAAAYKYRGIL